MCIVLNKFRICNGLWQFGKWNSLSRLINELVVPTFNGLRKLSLSTGHHFSFSFNLHFVCFLEVISHNRVRCVSLKDISLLRDEVWIDNGLWVKSFLMLMIDGCLKWHVARRWIGLNHKGLYLTVLDNVPGKVGWAHPHLLLLSVWQNTFTVTVLVKFTLVAFPP